MSVESLDVNYDDDIDVTTVMKCIDEQSRDLCIDEYLCVVAEGLAAWFWLRSKYAVPVICVNPVTDIMKTVEDICTEQTVKSFADIDAQRPYAAADVQALCVVSDDAPADVAANAYDTFGNSNTFVSEYELMTEEFWTDSRAMRHALDYAVKYFSD